MTLPALRLSYLRAWSCAGAMAEALRSQLLGKVLALPTALPRAEREETMDALALLLDLPVRPVISLEGEERPKLPGEILVLATPVATEPAPVPGAVVVCSIRRPAPYLDPPQELVILRDAIIHCWGLRYSGTRLQEVAVWLGSFTDSPATALRFADGALARHLADPQADDAVLFLAGLAAAMGWLLRGVDVRVAQWMLVRALDAPARGRLVSTGAAVLGEDAALQQAFGAGLVLTLPQEPGAPLDLRRPLAALGELSEAPGAPSLAAAAEALRPQLASGVYAVLERLVRSAPKPLGLEGPRPPKELAGREEVLRRLTTLCEPANEVRTTVLYGPPGVGKSTVAAVLGQRLRTRLEPVWVRFDSGLEAGWEPVANALGVSTGDARDEKERTLIALARGPGSKGPPPRDAAGVPFWVHEVHRRLRMGRYLVVVDGVKGVAEEELPRWLPTGPGRCSVLVLSETAQRPLQRAHEAIAMRLSTLSVEAARRVLVAMAPQQGEAIRRGEADQLIDATGGVAAGLVSAGNLLKHRSVEEVIQQIDSGDRAIFEILGRSLPALDEPESAVLMALAVAAPQGSPRALAVHMCGGVDAWAALERLLDRDLVEQDGRLVRLSEYVREAFLATVNDDVTEGVQETWRDFELIHANAACDLFAEAAGTDGRALQDDLYNDLLLATERLTTHFDLQDTDHRARLLMTCDVLSRHPRGDRDEALTRVVAGYRAALAHMSPDGDQDRWAAAQIQLAAALIKQVRHGDEGTSRAAIEALEQVLAVISKARRPDIWAAAQDNLGTAFYQLHQVLRRTHAPAREEVLQRAIDAHREALTVRTQEQHGALWAWTQANLGNALSSLSTGDRDENLRRALEAYGAAMTIFTREQLPAEWAAMRINVGSALSRAADDELSPEKKTAQIRAAIAAFEEVLSALNPEEYSSYWTAAQLNLAQSLIRFPEGSREENLRRAIEVCRSILSVLTPEQTPEMWADAHLNLGSALSLLPSGDRTENLRQALDAYRAALGVLSPDRNPEAYQQAQRALEEALRELAALAPEDLPAASSDPSG